MSTNKATYTRGAMRAASQIDALLRFETSEIESRNVEWLAEIIDRETCCKELLEALEAMTGWAHHGEESDHWFFSEENAPAYRTDDAKAMALIRKFRSEK
jgi:hypothetical protein